MSNPKGDLKMKITEAQSYQPVMFNKRNERFFSNRPGMQVEISLFEGQSAIIVKGDEDQVVIPFTNVAWFRFEDAKKPTSNAKKS